MMISKTGKPSTGGWVGGLWPKSKREYRRLPPGYNLNFKIGVKGLGGVR